MRAVVLASCCVLGACGFSISSGVAPEAGADDSPPLDATSNPDGDAPADANLVTMGLVAWYKMDSLSPIEDSSGHGHTGTCTSCPDLVPGKIGSGFEFNGVSELVTVASTAELNTTAGFTVAFWVQFDMLPGNSYSCPVSKVFGAGNANSWQLCYEAAQTAWMFGAQTTSGFTFLRRTPGPATDVWIHSAITYDGSTRRIWLNGASVIDQSGAAIMFDTMPIAIGADLEAGQPGSQFRGIVDDVRIYNRVLTAAELTLLAAM